MSRFQQEVTTSPLPTFQDNSIEEIDNHKFNILGGSLDLDEKDGNAEENRAADPGKRRNTKSATDNMEPVTTRRQEKTNSPHVAGYGGGGSVSSDSGNGEEILIGTISARWDINDETNTHGGRSSHHGSTMIDDASVAVSNMFDTLSVGQMPDNHHPNARAENVLAPPPGYPTNQHDQNAFLFTGIVPPVEGMPSIVGFGTEQHHMFYGRGNLLENPSPRGRVTPNTDRQINNSSSDTFSTSSSIVSSRVGHIHADDMSLASGNNAMLQESPSGRDYTNQQPHLLRLSQAQTQQEANERTLPASPNVVPAEEDNFGFGILRHAHNVHSPSLATNMRMESRGVPESRAAAPLATTTSMSPALTTQQNQRPAQAPPMSALPTTDQTAMPFDMVDATASTAVSSLTPGSTERPNPNRNNNRDNPSNNGQRRSAASATAASSRRAPRPQFVVPPRGPPHQGAGSGSSEFPFGLHPPNDNAKQQLHEKYVKMGHALDKTRSFPTAQDGADHTPRFTCYFVCPRTGECFAAGHLLRSPPAENPQRPSTQLLPQHIVLNWYTSKKKATEAAAARALDCITFRDDENMTDTAARYCLEEPYPGPDRNRLPPVPTQQLLNEITALQLEAGNLLG